MLRSIGRGVALACAMVALWAPSAPAAPTSQTINATANPSAQSQTLFRPADLQVELDTAFTIPSQSTQTMSQAVIHLDNDFAVDATGLAPCDPASLSGTTTDEAKAACPGSQVGSEGSATFCSTAGGCNAIQVPAAVTPFNGTASGSNPTLILHVKPGGVGEMADPLIAVGPYETSARGGDFGIQIALDFQAPPAGFIVTDIDFTLNDLTPAPGNYLSARCNDSPRLWDFAVDASFRAGAGTFSGTSAQSCVVSEPPPIDPGAPQSPGSGTGTPQQGNAPTGKRAAALKKCKKRKKRGRARRNCIRNAKRLPV
jgi:hypothetical protein